jgi:uncharacterized protein with HEPN domain
MDEAAFLADEKTRDAVERCFLRMSEAARKLGALAEAQAPGHDWVGLRAIGNILRHAYDEVDPRILWRIRNGELPALLRDAERESRG